jgi:hypothetical protein
MAIGVVETFYAKDYFEKVGNRRTCRTEQMIVTPGTAMYQGAIMLIFPRRTMWKVMSYIYWNYYGAAHNQSIWAFPTDKYEEVKAARIACSGWSDPSLSKKLWDESINNNIIASYDISTMGGYLDDMSLMITNNGAAAGAGSLFAVTINAVMIKESAANDSVM